VEVFYREVKGWLGLKEYQVRDKKSLLRHFILVFCAYTFILWHKLTGGLQRRWGNKPLKTFTEALKSFRTAMSFRFFDWLTDNRDVFALSPVNHRSTIFPYPYFNLSNNRSPTRKALAIIVRVGFTAALDLKKLPSTT
jgi:hypothetical protein